MVFFHSTDDHRDEDMEGTELPDFDSARVQARKMTGETLKDSAGQKSACPRQRVEVTDETGTLVFSNVTRATDRRKVKAAGLTFC